MLLLKAISGGVIAVFVNVVRHHRRPPPALLHHAETARRHGGDRRRVELSSRDASDCLAAYCSVRSRTLSDSSLDFALTKPTHTTDSHYIRSRRAYVAESASVTGLCRLESPHSRRHAPELPKSIGAIQAPAARFWLQFWKVVARAIDSDRDQLLDRCPPSPLRRRQ